MRLQTGLYRQEGYSSDEMDDVGAPRLPYGDDETTPTTPHDAGFPVRVARGGRGDAKSRSVAPAPGLKAAKDDIVIGNLRFRFQGPSTHATHTLTDEERARCKANKISRLEMLFRKAVDRGSRLKAYLIQAEQSFEVPTVDFQRLILKEPFTSVVMKAVAVVHKYDWRSTILRCTPPEQSSLWDLLDDGLISTGAFGWRAKSELIALKVRCPGEEDAWTELIRACKALFPQSQVWHDRLALALILDSPHDDEAWEQAEAPSERQPKRSAVNDQMVRARDDEWEAPPAISRRGTAPVSSRQVAREVKAPPGPPTRASTFGPTGTELTRSARPRRESISTPDYAYDQEGAEDHGRLALRRGRGDVQVRERPRTYGQGRGPEEYEIEYPDERDRAIDGYDGQAQYHSHGHDHVHGPAQYHSHAHDHVHGPAQYHSHGHDHGHGCDCNHGSRRAPVAAPECPHGCSHGHGAALNMGGMMSSLPGAGGATSTADVASIMAMGVSMGAAMSQAQQATHACASHVDMIGAPFIDSSIGQVIELSGMGMGGLGSMGPMGAMGGIGVVEMGFGDMGMGRGGHVVYEEYGDEEDEDDLYHGGALHGGGMHGGGGRRGRYDEHAGQGRGHERAAYDEYGGEGRQRGDHRGARGGGGRVSAGPYAEGYSDPYRGGRRGGARGGY
jgi:hypothetical protein